MTLPAQRPALVGVSRIRLWPWIGAGPYIDADACELEGLQHLEDVSTFKNAIEKGGDSPDAHGAYLEARELKVKVSAQKADLRLGQILMAGAFAMDSSIGGGNNEVQYYAPALDDWDTYFRLEAESTTGDGTTILRFFKCKLEGSLAAKREREKVTDIEFECLLFADKVAVRADGVIGGLSEYIWTEDGEREFFLPVPPPYVLLDSGAGIPNGTGPGLAAGIYYVGITFRLSLTTDFTAISQASVVTVPPGYAHARIRVGVPQTGGPWGTLAGGPYDVMRIYLTTPADLHNWHYQNVWGGVNDPPAQPTTGYVDSYDPSGAAPE